MGFQRWAACAHCLCVLDCSQILSRLHHTNLPNQTIVTVGCGGKPGDPGSGVAALDRKHIEEGSFYCKDPAVLNLKPTPVQPILCQTYQPKLGGFCWNKQPDFSAYRESAFGYAVLNLINATHAEWGWCVLQGSGWRFGSALLVPTLARTCTKHLSLTHSHANAHPLKTHQEPQ